MYYVCMYVCMNVCMCVYVCVYILCTMNHHHHHHHIAYSVSRLVPSSVPLTLDKSFDGSSFASFPTRFKIYIYIYIYTYIYIYIYLICKTTGPQTLSKSVLHRVQSSASCFNLHYPVFSLKSSSSGLHLLSSLPVTSNLPSLFFNNMFCKTVPTQYMTNPVSLSTFNCT